MSTARKTSEIVQRTRGLAQSKIQGWRNYYYTNYSQKRLAKLDWYILQRLTRWYAKKRQRRRWMGSLNEVKYIANQYGLKTLL
ncbi:group II intron maturase-specific domain-containing protein [Paenibacillus rhizoplanae]|uniref:group II intron maturase-specific domain-containing protein n=1 Tax=Paenibacillus rhizoplanae TaxID=1917181 RepID=UPI00361C2E82